MTEAYLEGFCKMAEACGVDPNTLLQKQAAPWGKLIGAGVKAIRGAGRAAGHAQGAFRSAGGGMAGARAIGSQAMGAVGRGASRLGELLGGGNANALSEITARSGRVSADMSSRGASMYERGLKSLKDYWRGLSGDFSQKGLRYTRNAHYAAQTAPGPYSRMQQMNQAHRYAGMARRYATGESEMRKVLAARAGAGAGILGGVNALSGGDQQ